MTTSVNNLASRTDDFFASLGVIVADKADVAVAHGAVATLAFADAYCVRLYGNVIPAERRRVVLDAFRARLSERRAAL
jgi:hypothetical protein